MATEITELETAAAQVVELVAEDKAKSARIDALDKALSTVKASADEQVCTAAWCARCIWCIST